MPEGAVLFVTSHSPKMDRIDTLFEPIPSAPFSVVYFNAPWSLDKAGVTSKWTASEKKKRS
jgi:hypothetical protein